MKDYFFKPPINQFSLNFLDQELERAYRTSYQEEVRVSLSCCSFVCRFRQVAHDRSCALAALFVSLSDRKLKAVLIPHNL